MGAIYKRGRVWYLDVRSGGCRVRRSQGWKPKTDDREIPINDGLFKPFQQLEKKNSRGLKSSYVFHGEDGGILKPPLREKLIKIAQEAGIENLTKIHSLRHAFASRLVMSGVDLPTVQKLMGHSDIETTMIHAHLASDHLANAIEKLSFS